jgi:hypothetical protein
MPPVRPHPAFCLAVLVGLIAIQRLNAECPPLCPEGATQENEACGEEINEGCDAPGPEGSNCCVPNHGYDCDDIGCFNAVCMAEPWCCKLVWDQMCADLAFELCPELCNGEVVQEWLPIGLGDTMCATTWADGYDSDADWYALTLDAVTEVTVTLATGVTLELGIADLDGVPQCPTDTELEPFAVVQACSSSSLTTCLEAGVHFVRIRPTALTGIPCGSDLAKYVLTVEGGDRPCVLPDPVNDTCETALPIGEGSTPVDTQDAATELLAGDDPCGTVPFRRDVWFTYTASRDGVLRIATCGTASFQAMIGLYHGSCGTLEPVACDHLGKLCSLGDPQLDADVQQGETYLIRVGSPNETFEHEGSIVLTLSYVPCEGPYVLELVGPPLHKSVATAVSNAGEIVGMFEDTEPFRWSEGAGVLEIPGSAAALFGVNNDGVAVGWIKTGVNLNKPMSSVGLRMTPLPNNLSLCESGIAYAINESGQIAGGLFASSCGSPTPVTWIGGAIAPLPVPAATGAARDINNAGSVCGDGQTSSSYGAGWTLIDGVFEWIPVPIPGTTMVPAAINDSNLVVGDIRMSGSLQTGFLWDGDSVTQVLPPERYPYSALVDVNNAGIALGEFRLSTINTANGGAFLLKQGGIPRMLNILLPAHPTLSIEDVRAINDSGVIVGAMSSSMTNSKAVRLVPQAPTGDTNCDGEVNGADLATVLGAWGECGINDTCLADFTLDGRIDGADLAVVLGGWGPVAR